jgi:exo-beta-1,3-glucanase (GH17 family)
VNFTRIAAMLTMIGLALLTLLVWYAPNRPQAANVTMPDARFHSVSYAPYRAWQSPLTGNFPRAAQVARDLALIARHADGIRTYSAREGDYDIGALAKAAGLKVWLGIWLSSNPRDNSREMAAGIAEAKRHPHTITRVVVGNEVLLRRDLPPSVLIRDIDQVKRQVTQPVAYADVASFWFEFPEVARHVDIVMIHLLPYWQNHPVDVEHAIARIARTVKQARRLFPGKRISIGETGWPSRGRWRGAAAPSRVNEAIFLRKFVSLADADHTDYNLIEAFDQNWKYHDEGIAGANWGIWNAARQAKFPLAGPVVEMPLWSVYAWAAIALGLILAWCGAARRRRDIAFAFALANGLVYACAVTWHVLYDRSLIICAAVNLPAQALFAWRALRHASLGAGEIGSGATITRTIRQAVNGRVEALGWRLPGFAALWFLFLFTAAIIQAFLVFDGRYRDAPFAVFAVPVIIAAWRLAARDLPPITGWEDWLPSALLALGAVVSAVIALPFNLEFLAWDGCALILAAPSLLAWRHLKPRRRQPAMVSPGEPVPRRAG